MLLRNVTSWFSQRTQSLRSSFSKFLTSKLSYEKSFSCSNWSICRFARTIFQRLNLFFRPFIRWTHKYIWTPIYQILNTRQNRIDSIEFIPEVAAIDPSLANLLGRAKQSVLGCDQAVLEYVEVCLRANPHLSLNPRPSVSLLTKELGETYWSSWLPIALKRKKDKIEEIAHSYRSMKSFPFVTMIISPEMRHTFQKMKKMALILFDITKDLHQAASLTRKRALKEKDFIKFLKTKLQQLNAFSKEGDEAIRDDFIHLEMFLAQTYTTFYPLIGNQTLNLSFLKI